MWSILTHVAIPRRYAILAMWIFVVAAAYYAAATIGLRLAIVGGQVTPLWPPTGIALACLILFGSRVWPGITLGALAANITLGPTAAAVVAISVGNTLAPVCAYLLLKKVGFRRELDRLVDALALVFLGAFAGMLISATIGGATLMLSGAIPASRFWATWSVWWAGDAMGVLTVAPLLLVATRIRLPKKINPYRAAEAVALVSGTFAVTVFATSNSARLLFLVFPFLIWAALRFQLAGAVPCALIVSTVTILAAARGAAPFAGLSLATTMIVLQAFNGSVALTALLHAAITAERDRARQDVEDACAQLAQAVNLLSQGRPLPVRVLDVVERARPRP
jgi:integral membrane sensor domain MASE1